jgi:hypothetical protein
MLAAIGRDNEYIKGLYGEMTTGKIEDEFRFCFQGVTSWFINSGVMTITSQKDINKMILYLNSKINIGTS